MGTAVGLPLSGSDRGDRVREMFGRIVPRYDLMNRLMTGGMDGRWRLMTARQARPQGALALDLATGTGDLALQLRALGARRVIAADYCAPMLEAAEVKLRERGAFGIELIEADALALPFASDTFDCVTSGFLLRNVADLPRALAEMYRVLRPGGRAVSLELTHMPPSPIAAAFGSYFQHVVPWIGGKISGDPMAYTYLPASVRAFPTAARLSQLFREAGFQTVSHQLVGVGTVAIHTATREA
jgi:demethylmenaquinone methyltransferase / 2-methoxy-6-polyprenyl-1,4-benzoquinol methylase